MLFHAREKLQGNRVTRPRSDNGINAAPRANRSIISGGNIGSVRALADPNLDLCRQEHREAIEATAGVALENLSPMSTATRVGGNDVLGWLRRGHGFTI